MSILKKIEHAIEYITQKGSRTGNKDKYIDKGAANSIAAYNALNQGDWELFLKIDSQRKTQFQVDTMALFGMVDRGDADLIKKYWALIPKEDNVLQPTLTSLLKRSVLNDNVEIFSWLVQQEIENNYKFRQQSFEEGWREIAFYLFLKQNVSWAGNSIAFNIANYYILHEKTDINWLKKQSIQDFRSEAWQFIESVLDKNALDKSLEQAREIVDGVKYKQKI